MADCSFVEEPIERCRVCREEKDKVEVAAAGGFRVELLGTGWGETNTLNSGLCCLSYL